MRKKNTLGLFSFIVIFMCIFNNAHAQESIRIMSYNMYSYASNTDRDTFFISVLSTINPDIYVGIEMKSSTWAANFRDNVLNQIGNGTYAMGTYVSFSGGTGTNTIYYRSDKFTFISATRISTNPVIVFILKHIPTNRQIIIFGTHLSAGSDDTPRQTEVALIREKTDAYSNGEFFIAVGDYNFVDATDASFGMFTNTNNSGYFIDPEGYDGSASWSENLLLRTHNIRTSFQYRHDMILNSQSVVNSGGVEYVSGSYTIPGNIDGNKSSIPQMFLDASDHLPVYADYLFYDIPAPVELTLFVGVFKNNQIELNWKTATEVNNFGFDVERLTDKSHWLKIGFVQGHGNSNIPHYYNFIDSDLIDHGIYYYRLKQVDNDGAFEYSNVISIPVNLTEQYILNQNYPNPFNPNTTIEYSISTDGFVTLIVYDILGKPVKTLVDKFQKSGRYKINFNAGKLSSGIYFYRIIVSDIKNPIVSRFIKTKSFTLVK